MSNHDFATIPKTGIQRSKFDRSHNWKGTMNAGLLVPFFVDEVLPGDSFNVSVSMLCRLATPIVPIMDNLYLDTFFFYVPNRLVWINFVKMMGEQEDPDDSIDYLVPQLFGSNTSVEAESVFDYMGLPLGDLYGAGGTTNNKLNCSALPARMLCLIWNTWFRDENLQDSIKIKKDDSPGYFTDSTSLPNGYFFKSGSCLPRGKRHDYFTSALPFVSKFGTVDIPLGTSAPVLSDPTNPIRLTQVNSGAFTTPSAYTVYNASTGAVDASQIGATALVNGHGFGVKSDSGLYADLSNATAATINTLRQAFQVQRLLERDARGGTRYNELIFSHFNTTVPDARVQRPEYLGGSSTPFIINPVTQTSSTDSTTPQGNLSAFGVCAPKYHGFTKSFCEHGFVIGLVSVRADLNYQQGLSRMWSRRTRYDYYWPELAHLGEQAILNQEIYAQGTSDDKGVFGYQERYAEYRYFPNMVTGKFRSTYSSPLDSWHLAQKFDSLPTLSDSFIRDNPPVGRVIAVPSEPQFLLDVYFKCDCVRPMPMYGVPGLIDHF